MNGSISINKVISNDKTFVRVTLEDEKSGVPFATLSLSLEAYAQAVTVLSGVKGDLQLYGLNKVGKQHEYQTVSIKRPCDYVSSRGDISDVQKRAIDEQLPSEIRDGWVVRYEDAYNSHNWCEKNKVNVGMDRWV